MNTTIIRTVIKELGYKNILAITLTMIISIGFGIWMGLDLQEAIQECKNCLGK